MTTESAPTTSSAGGWPFAGRVLVVGDADVGPRVTEDLVAIGVPCDAVVPAPDLRAAVRTIERAMPAMAIVDLDVAEHGGPVAVRRLREIAPGLPLLVLAGDDDVASAGLSAGADVYLV